MPEPSTRPGNTERKPRSASSYIPGLDGIRALAFLMVFGAHATPGPISHIIPATLGVTTFFFLSGFLITTLLRKEFRRTGDISLRDFYIRRTLRIFIPLYLVYGLVTVFDKYVLHEFAGNRRGLVAMLLYVYNYAILTNFHALAPAGLDVIWSLGVEEHFYILFPVLYLFMQRRRFSIERQTRYILIFCSVELAWRFVLALALHRPQDWTYFATDARLDGILWGCLLAMRNNPVFGDRKFLPRGREALAFGVAVFTLAMTLVPTNLLYRGTIRYTLQPLCLYVIFSFVLTNIRHWSVRWLEWTPLRYVGWTSYVLYLCHRPLVDYAMKLFHGRLQLSVPVGFCFALAFASVVRYTVELPLQTLRARFRRVPEADPTAADHHGLVS